MYVQKEINIYKNVYYLKKENNCYQKIKSNEIEKWRTWHFQDYQKQQPPACKFGSY